jgi:glycosyltransferase involved in cell wall biosynthesis
MRFSVIIPAYNEEAVLPRLLKTIAAAREAYGGPLEVIVADNVSTDATAQIAGDAGCKVVRVEKRVIAAVRNAGARVAEGEILAFVDADAQIHPDTFNEIDRLMVSGNAIGGATGMRFDRSSLALTLTFALLSTISVLLTRQLTRDVPTGVTFCRRRDFEEIGGYHEERLFAEDVQLLLDLKKLGRKRGERLVVGTKAKAIVSTRKFDKFGEWHYFTLPFRFASEKWVRRYWYER